MRRISAEHRAAAEEARQTMPPKPDGDWDKSEWVEAEVYPLVRRLFELCMAQGVGIVIGLQVAENDGMAINRLTSAVAPYHSPVLHNASDMIQNPDEYLRKLAWNLAQTSMLAEMIEVAANTEGGKDGTPV